MDVFEQFRLLAREIEGEENKVDKGCDKVPTAEPRLVDPHSSPNRHTQAPRPRRVRQSKCGLGKVDNRD